MCVGSCALPCVWWTFKRPEGFHSNTIAYLLKIKWKLGFIFFFFTTSCVLLAHCDVSVRFGKNMRTCPSNSTRVGEDVGRMERLGNGKILCERVMVDRSWLLPCVKGL